MAANSAPPQYQVQCMPPLPINPEKRESPYLCEVVGANERGGDGATATATEQEARGNECVRVRERLSESERETE